MEMIESVVAGAGVPAGATPAETPAEATVGEPAAPLSAVPAADEESPIDWKAAMSTVGGDRELLLGVVQAFLEESSCLLTSLRQAVAPAWPIR